MARVPLRLPALNCIGFTVESASCTLIRHVQRGMPCSPGFSDLVNDNSKRTFVIPPLQSSVSFMTMILYTPPK